MGDVASAMALPGALAGATALVIDLARGLGHVDPASHGPALAPDGDHGIGHVPCLAHLSCLCQGGTAIMRPFPWPWAWPPASAMGALSKKGSIARAQEGINSKGTIINT